MLPNHLMLIAVTFPDNPSSGSSPNYNIAKSLPASLQANKLTWRNYGGYAFNYINHGWYDHVTPPNTEKWTDGSQFRYGSRVPCLVRSPYTKAVYISKPLHSFCSILKFRQVNFGLATLNKRDAATDNMGDGFDFTQKPLGPPK